MDNKILKESYKLVLNDSKFVRLITFSFLPYSFLFVWYLFYQAYFFFSNLNPDSDFVNIKNYIDQVFSFWQDFLIFMVIVWIIIGILYFLMPPVWEASLIHYLDKDKSLSDALGKGFTKFFKMFELHGFLSLFSFLFYFVFVSRLYVLDLFDVTFVLPLLIIWFFFVAFFNFSLFYSRFLIVLEKYDAFDSIKESIRLSILNFRKTWKYFIIYMLLYLRYIINIFIVVGIPLIILYFFLKTDVSNIEFVKYSILIIMSLLFVLVAYVNGIIEAFFISMWYEVFKILDRD